MAWQSGSKLGSWELVEVLGSGGNADVWRARSGTLEAAVKILHKRAVDSEPYKRFGQEIAALQHLQGVPGILPLLDFNLPEKPSKENPAWLAMPVATPILRALGTDAPFDNVVNRVAEVAETLAAAAEAGVAHRDIKSENLFVHEGRAQIRVCRTWMRLWHAAAPTVRPPGTRWPNLPRN